EVSGPAVQAALTVTFALPKRCLLLYPAARYAGTVRIVPIGIPLSLCQDPELLLGVLERQDVVSAFPKRDPAAHKGTFGHVLVIAGSVGKTGAAALTSLAALRVGAGLVTLAIPQSLNDAMEAKLTEVMTEPVAETEARSIGQEALDRLLQLAVGKDAVALGPGLGTHPSTQKLVHELLSSLKTPIVLDADGINALAGRADILTRAAAPVILTPHPGELSRLLDVPRDEVLRKRISLAQDTASRLNVTLVLKMAHTVVASPSHQVVLVPTGNPGMATGGTGDVLTGLISGLLAQGVTPGHAASAGVYLHGLAGDLAAGHLGQEAMLAGDLLNSVPDAIRQLKEKT
ncbi:MAG TPA: NAD(P)H-hydrate dehydratase, partial [Candidatus Acidoferrum sp.]|nr:NAD(P)H-hydrate dehydratase [Candidatus Acidoferrum sp.]